ncbi:hypothetical protein CB1_000287002 [Camelus ferus]|nr:hypothetical protein CB1_000287002 [Camelus ferus]
MKTFDANDLYQGQNFNKVLSSLVTLNKVTADIGLGSDSVCARPSSHRIKSFDSLGSQPSHCRTSKLFQGQYRSLGVLPAAPGEWALDSCRVPGADAALALDGAQHVRPCPLGHPVPDERLTRCHRMSEPACCPFPAR